MATYDERYASFAPRKPKSNKKNAINAFIARGWPHPTKAMENGGQKFKATPSSLAHAGFFFDPRSDKEDNVTCFTCEHSLAEWTSQDDPFEAHLNMDTKCAWAVARCSIELDRQKDGSFRFTSTARMPTSKTLEKARADTFKGYWIHDSVKAHTANSKKMAKAGWIFNPGEAEDSDIATCFYCGKSLDGWEQGDDPTQEHRNRMPQCPMFTAKLIEVAEPEAAVIEEPVFLPTASSSSTVRGKTTSKRAPSQAPGPLPVAAEGGISDVPTESDAPTKRSRSKKSTAVKQKTSSSQIDSVPPLSQVSSTSISRANTLPTNSSDRNHSFNVASESSKAKEPLLEPVSDAPSSKAAAPKKKKRDTRKAGSTIATDTEVEAEIVSMSQQSAAEEEDVTMKAPPKKGKKAPSKKSKKSKTPSAPPSIAASEDLDVEMSDLPARDNGRERKEPRETSIVQSRPPADSLGGWTSLDAAEQELEAMAKELHIEGEFAAIGKTSSSSSTKPSNAMKSSTSSSKATTKGTHPPNPWSWRAQSVSAQSVVTEADMTEEEEVEKSLAGDDDDIGGMEDDDIERPTLSPPASREPSVGPSLKAASTVPSTTTTTKTKKKSKDMKTPKAPSDPRTMALKKEAMEDTADQPTPKARRTVESNTTTLVSRPTLPHFDSSAKNPFAVEAGSNPFFVPPSATESAGMDVDMKGRLEAPTLRSDVDSYRLTEEEREMTLEEWVQYDVENRKDDIRREGRKMIEIYLDNAERMREMIRGW
ncbi:hypothetical protein FRC17_011102 [Serendipita sp. 399]|nr:hypothetical protein FRC17_011102 [Serendipita sp. 399]